MGVSHLAQVGGIFMMAGCSEVANPSALNRFTLKSLNCFAPGPGKVSIGLTTASWFCDMVLGQGPDQYPHMGICGALSF